ncbi:uncharacterized protein DS421_18g633440 [Arachis hypogaea]|nr:uncharacterized protein DS421_18g633440 [Arachis hypogaea]
MVPSLNTMPNSYDDAIWDQIQTSLDRLNSDCEKRSKILAEIQETCNKIGAIVTKRIYGETDCALTAEISTKIQKQQHLILQIQAKSTSAFQPINNNSTSPEANNSTITALQFQNSASDYENAALMNAATNFSEFNMTLVHTEEEEEAEELGFCFLVQPQQQEAKSTKTLDQATIQHSPVSICNYTEAVTQFQQQRQNSCQNSKMIDAEEEKFDFNFEFLPEELTELAIQVECQPADHAFENSIPGIPTTADLAISVTNDSSAITRFMTKNNTEVTNKPGGRGIVWTAGDRPWFDSSMTHPGDLRPDRDAGGDDAWRFLPWEAPNPRTPTTDDDARSSADGGAFAVWKGEAHGASVTGVRAHAIRTTIRGRDRGVWGFRRASPIMANPPPLLVAVFPWNRNRERSGEGLQGRVAASGRGRENSNSEQRRVESWTAAPVPPCKLATAGGCGLDAGAAAGAPLRQRNNSASLFFDEDEEEMLKPNNVLGFYCELIQILTSEAQNQKVMDGTMTLSSILRISVQFQISTGIIFCWFWIEQKFFQWDPGG